MIISTFLFAIISLNLLVSIIGDKHTENKEAEAKTRIFEMINIIGEYCQNPIGHALFAPLNTALKNIKGIDINPNITSDLMGDDLGEEDY